MEDGSSCSEDDICIFHVDAQILLTLQNSAHVPLFGIYQSEYSDVDHLRNW